MTNPKSEITFDFDIYNPLAQDFIGERSFDFWEDISNATKKNLKRVMQSGITEGLTTTGLTEAVMGDVFDSLTGKDGFTRARRIARTETTIALNQGQYAAYKQSGIKMGKSWLTSQDEVVRDTHRAAEAEGVISMDNVFGNRLKHPGDPSGEVKELVNCRCSLLPEVDKKEAQRVATDKFGNTFNNIEGNIPLCNSFLISDFKVFTGKCLTNGDADKIKRAVDSYKPATRAVQQQGELNELKLAKIIKGTAWEDNEPFDVFIGAKNNPNHFIEVKTIVRGKNDKITMHKSSLKRKIDLSKKFKKAKVHTVVFDDRNNKIFYKEDVGSFRLNNMDEVNLKILLEIFK